nr:hypothetical protein [Tanacetum cinerariifolium]
MFGRSFLRLTKGIVDFGNGVTTIYLDLEFFGDDYDNSNDSGDDWDAILKGMDFGDISQLDGMLHGGKHTLYPFSSRNKKKPCGNYKMTYSDEGPSLIVKNPLTQEQMSREAIKKIFMKEF